VLLVIQVVGTIAAASLDNNAIGVDDVISDVLMITFLHRDRIRAGSEDAWIRAVTRRTIANRQRAARRHDALLHQLRTVANGVAVAAADITHDDDLRRTLKGLPEPDRVTLALIADDHSTAEIARALQISNVAARQRVARARQRLRHAYLETRAAPTMAATPANAAAPLSHAAGAPTD
jgi:RNA polymerase sigma factor (sigma-70 family)